MLSAIERGLLEWVGRANQAGFFGPAGFRVVASYGGELDDLGQAARQFPAFWCVLREEAAPERVSDAALIEEHAATWTLFVACDSRRSDAAARLGATPPEPGAYALVERLQCLLRGRVELADGLTDVANGACQLVLLDRAAVCYRLDLVCRWRTVGRCELAPAADGDLLRVHVDWDVEPIGNVKPPLPAAEADARDDVYFTREDDR